MLASKAYAKGLYNVNQWSWQTDGTVIITLVDNSTGKSGTMHWNAVNGRLDQLLEDSQMEVKP